MRGFHQASSGISPATSPQDVEDAQYQPQPHSPLASHTGLLVNQYQSIGYETNFPDQIAFQETKTQSGRSRKRSSPGLDHVKHRRTRSGCYTCRYRRVKCDENRPICDRCRKGKRDCVYPDPPAAKGTASSSTSKEPASMSQEVSPDPSVEDGDDFEKEPTLESIPDEDEPIELSTRQPRSPQGPRREPGPSAFNLRKTSNRQNSETPSLDDTKSSSPSISTGTSVSFTPTIPQLNTTNLEWAHLPKDLKYYMDYYGERITHFNYGMTNDTDGFFKSILPSLAVREGNDALLYAVVAFSAYHSMLRHPNGRIESFLEYYNKSVQILRSNLDYEHQRNLPALLAILQLATIEEYLGDWVNLAVHQKAAVQILTQLCTPETIMRSRTNALLAWYIRFDLFVSTMGGFVPALPREWVVSAMEGGQERLRENPDDVSWRIAMQAAELRLISMDMSILYAKNSGEEISPERFAREYNDILMRLSEWKTKLDPRITDSNYLVTDFQHKRPLTDDDIVNPYKPGFLYKGPLFATTILLLKWHSIRITHMSRQAGYKLHQEPSNELRQLSLSACELFETVRLWPEAPAGVTITVQSCLAMACLFMPRDQRHNMWIRRRYASLEAAGYISPPTMRARMAELFRDPSCNHWWLPHDEGLVPILRSIRAFADARDDSDPITEQTEALREMSAIFSNMHIGNDDGPSPREPAGPNPSAGRKGKNVQGRS